MEAQETVQVLERVLAASLLASFAIYLLLEVLPRLSLDPISAFIITVVVYLVIVRGGVRFREEENSLHNSRGSA